MGSFCTHTIFTIHGPTRFPEECKFQRENVLKCKLYILHKDNMDINLPEKVVV